MQSRVNLILALVVGSLTLGLSDDKVNRKVVRAVGRREVSVASNAGISHPVIRKARSRPAVVKAIQEVEAFESLLNKRTGAQAPAAFGPDPTPQEDEWRRCQKRGPGDCDSATGDALPVINIPHSHRAASLALASKTTCKVTLYEHWAPGIDSNLAKALIGEADASLWEGKFPEGKNFAQVGTGKFPLGSFNWTSSVKVEGDGCMVHAYTTDDCSGSPRSPYPISSSTQITSGYPANIGGTSLAGALPGGLVTPARNLVQFWFCNDCVRCIRVTQDSAASPTIEPQAPFNYVKHQGICKAETGSLGSTCACGWKFPFSCAHLGNSVNATAIEVFKEERNWACTLHINASSPKCPDGCSASPSSTTVAKYIGDGTGNSEGPSCWVKGSSVPSTPWKGKSLKARGAYALDAARDGCPATTNPYFTSDCCCGQGCCWGQCFAHEPGHTNWAEYYKNATYRHTERVSTDSTDEFPEPPQECLIGAAEGARWVPFVNEWGVSAYQIDFYVERPVIPANPEEIFHLSSDGPCTTSPSNAAGGYCDCNYLAYDECLGLAGGLNSPATEFDKDTKNCKVMFLNLQAQCPSYCTSVSGTSAVTAFNATTQTGSTKVCHLKTSCPPGYAESDLFVEAASVTRNYTAANAKECGARCHDQAGCKGFFFDGAVCQTSGATAGNTATKNGLKACWKSAPTLWTAPDNYEEAGCNDSALSLSSEDCKSLDCQAAEFAGCFPDGLGGSKCYSGYSDPMCAPSVTPQFTAYPHAQPHTFCDNGVLVARCRNKNVSKHQGYWQGAMSPTTTFDTFVNGTKLNMTNGFLGSSMWTGDIQGDTVNLSSGISCTIQPDGAWECDDGNTFVRSANTYKH